METLGTFACQSGLYLGLAEKFNMSKLNVSQKMLNHIQKLIGRGYRELEIVIHQEKRISLEI